MMTKSMLYFQRKIRGAIHSDLKRQTARDGVRKQESANGRPCQVEERKSMIHKEEIPDSMLFAGIHPEEKESILKCLSAVEKKYEKGDAVFLAGTAIRSMGLILSGSVDISRDDFWGNRQVLGHAGSGELFGEAYACMPGESLMVNVEAAEKCRILFLDIGKILNVCTPACSHHNRLIHNLLYIMAKVMAYLSFESEKQKKKTFGIPFNRQQLADYLAVDRSALSAELSRMKKDGLIEFEKNIFTLL